MRSLDRFFFFKRCWIFFILKGFNRLKILVHLFVINKLTLNFSARQHDVIPSSARQYSSPNPVHHSQFIEIEGLVITRLVVAYVRWIQDGWQRDRQLRRWNRDCLSSQMNGCHANQGSLHFMLSQSKTTMGETQIYSRHKRSDSKHQIKSKGVEVRKV